MSDIVQELRANGVVTIAQWDAMREKATDEIERLRAALKLAKDALERNTGNYSFVLQTIADALE